MSELGPYSRVYWSVLDDKKFDEIRADMRHFGSWSLMLVIADMAYPAPAFIPPTIPRQSLKALEDAGLVDLLPARMYRVRGLKKERERRSTPGRLGAAARWARTDNALPSESDRNGHPMPAKKSIEETRQGRAEHTAREGLPHLDEEAIRMLEEVTGRPWSLAGDKQLGEYDRLVGDHGLAAVAGAFTAVADGKQLTARQLIWPAMKLLEPMPGVPNPREGEIEDERRKQAERKETERHAKRLEYFSVTGKWDPNFGPEPDWNPDWGERPTRKATAA